MVKLITARRSETSPAPDCPQHPWRDRVLAFRSFPGRLALLSTCVRIALLGGLLAFTATARAEVSPTGAFEHSVPLKVPPFHGLEPRLALSYSSSDPNGWLGVGWSLQGLSVIRRGSAGQGVPRWGASDGYELDGRELIACPPDGTPSNQNPWERSPSCTYRVSGQVAYTTRVESFQRIGFVPDPDGGRWEVWRTDGVKATYLPGTRTASGVLEWHLSTVEDLSGNTVRFDYTTPSGTGSGVMGAQVEVLKDISYGDVQIDFQVEPRPDPIAVATGGGVLWSNTRLQAIDERTHAGDRIRAYALRYTTHPEATRRSFLASVQQYGSDATVDASGVHGWTALPAITFDAAIHGAANQWAPRLPAQQLQSWDSAPTLPGDDGAWMAVLASDQFNSRPVPVRPATDWVTGDFNGDRLSDTAVVDSQYLYVQMARREGGWDREVLLSGAPQGDIPKPLVGDVNGDGYDDLLLVSSSSSATYVTA